MEYLNTLNTEQRSAVVALDGPCLILAGAGSGKTRVLTQRIVHLVHEHKCDLSQIFAVTFTNKAAEEMRNRVASLMQGQQMATPYSSRIPMHHLWVSTFHSACMRILRTDIHHLGYQNSFTIYDDTDQLSVIKAVMKELNIAENLISPKAIQGRINKLKNDCQPPQTYKPNYTSLLDEYSSKVFMRYSEVLHLSSALDFGDLILLTVELFRKFPTILAEYQNRFRYILIDEYQDTNKCQYELIKLLASHHQNICVVGDEDQSIYKWRGADISNILNFEKDFPNARIFKLEQNYRSSKNIIEAASHVISHNTERREKELWTVNAERHKIHHQDTYHEHDEAFKVGSEIQKAISDGVDLNEMAIFYRTNAQSRLLEDRLRTLGLNYQIYGGLKFYDRLEIKDSLGYLKLVMNPDDDVSFRRIVNVPARGIGAVSLDKLVEQARHAGLSLFRTLEAAFGPQPKIALDLGRGQKNFIKFYQTMITLIANQPKLLPSDFLNFVLNETNYRKSLMDEQTIESQSRLENLNELRQSLIEYELRVGAEQPEAQITLTGFLEQIALVSSLDKKEVQGPAIKMMTIHMAKGLEFNRVFIVGLEEELFPNIKSWEMEQSADLEEERRLLYVGMTRARQHLQLYYAKNRMIYGHSQFRVPSRFLEEIPQQYLDLKKADYFTRKKPWVEKPGLEPSHDEFSQISGEDEDDGLYRDEPHLKVGIWIQHPLFGQGVIQKRLGRDKLVVLFQNMGIKKISIKFSPVEVLGGFED